MNLITSANNTQLGVAFDEADSTTVAIQPAQLVGKQSKSNPPAQVI